MFTAILLCLLDMCTDFSFSALPLEFIKYVIKIYLFGFSPFYLFMRFDINPDILTCHEQKLKN